MRDTGGRFRIGTAMAGTRSCGLLAAGLLAFAPMSQAKVWHVSPGIADGVGSGDAWGDPVSLQTALTDAAADDEIWVEAGTYTPTSLNGLAGADPRDKHFRLKTGVAIYGGFAGTEATLEERDFRTHETILDGDLGADGQVYHVIRQFEVKVDATAVLDGVTIVNGLADGILDRNDGGAMFLIDCSPTVRNCTFADNACAIANLGSGGAVYIEGTFGEGAAPVFTNCVFRGNEAGYDGGAVAIYNSYLSPTLAGCLFYDNTSPVGGAVGLYGNSGETFATIVNCTFSENNAFGEAIATYDEATCTIINSVVRGTSPIIAGQRGVLRGVNLVTYSNVEGGHAGTGNINADPLFADAGNDDFRLLPASPSVDTGSNAAVPLFLTVDLDGEARIAEDVVDMGAYEYHQPTALLTLAVVGDGETLPAAGAPTEVLIGVPVDIEAIPAAGWTFTGWSITAGNVTLGDAAAISTTVTLNDSNGATLTAGFAWMVTAGSEFPINANDVVGLPNVGNFRLKPTIYAVYRDPVKLLDGKMAKAKILTKVDKTIGAGAVDCTWTRKIKLFNSKTFKTDQAAGQSAADWLALAAGNQEPLTMDLRLDSKEAGVDDQSLNDQAQLVPPEIAAVTPDVDADGNDLLIITGRWFGLKKPKVSREYLDAKTGLAIKQQKCKVLTPDLTYTDAKGKPVCMDRANGDSRVVVQVPAKDPGGLNGVVVLDNGVGMAAVSLP